PAISSAASADDFAVPVSWIKVAISAWLITIPSTSPLSPNISSAIDNRLILFLSRSLSSSASSSTTYSPTTPISTKKADPKATLSDGVNDSNQRIETTNIQIILNIQEFMCAGCRTLGVRGWVRAVLFLSLGFPQPFESSLVGGAPSIPVWNSRWQDNTP